MKVGHGSIGDVVPAPGGRARVEIEVQAAPWVSVDLVRLYQNGREVKRWPVARSVDGLRFRDFHDVTLPQDGYVVVRVDGNTSLSPIVGDLVRFDVMPLALTNPAFLDVDGNGKFDAPSR